MRKRFINTVERFKQLLTGRGAEEQELSENKHLRQVYDNLQDDDFLAKKFVEYRAFSYTDAYRDFVTVVRKKRLRKRLVWGSAVAAMFFFLFGIIWLYRSEPVHSGAESAVFAEKSMIPAGSSKAQITLASGEIIDVGGDSLKVRTKDGMEINYTEGMVSYRNENEVTELVYNCLTVPVGGECYIVLDDGTRVWMNADSKLRYPVKFVAKERTVELEGEAYFEVSKGDKPFIVQTACGNVFVHGTSFNVKSYIGEEVTYTTLVSGQVSYEYMNQSVVLQPGEQVVVPVNGTLEKRKVNVSEYIGWKDGLYIFKKRSLESIMKELARWYDIEVVYQEEELKEISFTGNLERYDSIDAFMKILQRSGDVNYRIEGRTIVLYK